MYQRKHNLKPYTLLRICILLAIFSGLLMAEGMETFNQIEIALGTAKQSKRYHILEVGPVAENSTRSIELLITNIGEKSVALTVYSVGSKIAASWNNSANESTQLGVTAKFSAAETKPLRIYFKAGKLTTQDFNMITFNEDKSIVTSIVIDYSVHKKEVWRNIDTTRLPSGVGTSYNEPAYLFCSGPAPVGYTHIGNPHQFWISCWNCIAGCEGDTYAECRSIQINDKNVCYTMKFQGNGHHSPPDVKYAEAHLHVLYRLKEFPAVLK